MKVIVLGYGSIGKRHVRNLRALHPHAQIVVADPLLTSGAWPDTEFADWHDALIAHPDANAAIIASPTDCHGAHMDALATIGIPFYVEKPLGTTTLPRYPLDSCAVGFQYRFHPAMPRIEQLAREEYTLGFYARDALLDRYGAQVADIMAAHPIDTAVRLFGAPWDVKLESDGVRLRGTLYHERARRSVFDLSIGEGPRVSYVNSGMERVDLQPDESMYVEALRAWLTGVQLGEHIAPLATIADGLAVERVLAEVRYVHPR